MTTGLQQAGGNGVTPVSFLPSHVFVDNSIDEISAVNNDLV